MVQHLRANLWLLGLTILLCVVIYPGFLWIVGQTVFPEKANGSLIEGKDGPIGSRLIAQPFTGEEYFQPRPSAVSYNAAATGGTNWGANNYLLRDRVARQLGPLVKNRGGARKGQPVGPEVETWLQRDLFQGKPAVVAQWAQAHSTLAANWVKADSANAEYVTAWMKANPAAVEAWKKDNPNTPEPKPEDLAMPFFVSYAAAHPGTFPIKGDKGVAPAKTGTDIQSIFFDMWRQEHPDADLEPVPADMVMASGAGLDPHITMKNALYQLDRVAAKWAKDTNKGVGQTRQEIEALLREKTEAPLLGLGGVELVNVLEVNLALRDRYLAKKQ